MLCSRKPLMKFILIVEDTPKGIRCTATYKGNDVADSMEQSLAAKVIANFSVMLKEFEAAGALYVEKE